MKQAQKVATAIRGQQIILHDRNLNIPMSSINVWENKSPKKHCDREVLLNYLNRGWSYSHQREVFIREQQRQMWQKAFSVVKKEINKFQNLISSI